MLRSNQGTEKRKRGGKDLSLVGNLENWSQRGKESGERELWGKGEWW